ncbi:MAG: hypothetical protein ACJARF_002222 [Alteromonadaceae bacterium]|jgi:hypothetical protein
MFLIKAIPFEVFKNFTKRIQPLSLYEIKRFIAKIRHAAARNTLLIETIKNLQL